MARSINESIKQPAKQPTNIMDMQLRKHNFLHNVFCLCRAGFCVCRAFYTFVTRNVLFAQIMYRHSVRKACAIRLAPYMEKYIMIMASTSLRQSTAHYSRDACADGSPALPRSCRTSPRSRLLRPSRRSSAPTAAAAGCALWWHRCEATRCRMSNARVISDLESRGKPAA